MDRGMLTQEFILGFSHCNDLDYMYPWSERAPSHQTTRLISDLTRAGAKWWRPHIHWNRVEPEVFAGITDVDSYMKKGRWADYDMAFGKLKEAGVGLCVVLGCGYTVQLPFFHRNGQAERFLPDRAGQSAYLERLGLHARAAVRRYKGQVGLWQIENELHVAGETCLFRWRHGRSWWSPGFQTKVLETLWRAVKDEDPNALTTHNFHTDLRILHPMYSWKRDIKRWKDFLDVIGLDIYPNYLFGRPILGGLVGKKVRAALSLGLKKPVIVLETGYPSAPWYRLFNEAGQRTYVDQALRSTRGAEAQGFFYFCLVSSEGLGDPRWERKRTPFLQEVENWWGLVKKNGEDKAGFEAFRRGARAR